MSSIDPTFLLSNLNSSSTSSNQGKDVLGKDDFLKLLIAQLQNQDPSSPMDDEQFISQMANFTSLEQTQNMTDMLQTFIQSQSNTELTQYADMIGKTISYNKETTNAEGNTSSNLAQGIVQSVSLINGSIQFTTDTGDTLNLGDIQSIEQTPGATANF